MENVVDVMREPLKTEEIVYSINTYLARNIIFTTDTMVVLGFFYLHGIFR